MRPRVQLSATVVATVAHTGEVFLNITNLHRLTGFFLVQQALIARPVTIAQRLGDVTLTFLVVIGCAAVQAYFLNTAGLHTPADDLPVHLIPLLQAAGSRLIIWPLFGARGIPLGGINAACAAANLSFTRPAR